ncbi:MAG: hypothetical protein GX448_01055 [Planctomycetes bacterium]|nr:hypothetical protein [Planctomycetota bacterium]
MANRLRHTLPRFSHCINGESRHGEPRAYLCLEDSQNLAFRLPDPANRLDHYDPALMA